MQLSAMLCHCTGMDKIMQTPDIIEIKLFVLVELKEDYL
jgi:hypothetical protein